MSLDFIGKDSVKTDGVKGEKSLSDKGIGGSLKESTIPEQKESKSIKETTAKIPRTKGRKGITSKLTSKEMEIIYKSLETSMNYEDLLRKVNGRLGRNLSKPTVMKLADDVVKKKFANEKSVPSVKDILASNRKNKRRWLKEFELARRGIAETFKKDYLTTDDGVAVNWETTSFEPMPPPHMRGKGKNKKDILNFTVSGHFGWIQDENNKEGLGTGDFSVAYLVTNRLKKLAMAKANYNIKVKINAELARRRKELDAAGIDYNLRDLRRQVKEDLKDEINRVKQDYEEKYKILSAKLETDIRTRMLHERLDELKDLDPSDPFYDEKIAYIYGDIMKLNLDPATCSSDKTYRGRWRVLALPGRKFSRIIYNLPEELLLYNHEKRTQIFAHNGAKKLPELLHGEVPKWSGEFKDIKGHNARIRLAKNVYEDIMTREAGFIISEDLAKRFRYFYNAEDGSLVAPMPEEFMKRKGQLGPDEIAYIQATLPDTIRVEGPIKDYKDYKRKIKDRGFKPLWVNRNDVLSVGGFENISEEAGTARARHSGYIVFTGKPKRMYRRLSMNNGREYLDVYYYKQPYQIVRESDITIGSKLIGRTGLKGVVADIWPREKMGKDEQGRYYDAIVNPKEVWKESDDPLKDETFFLLGKKRSGIPLEHMKSDGTNFLFEIDKFSEDGKAYGLRYSPTLITGLWEIFEKKYAPDGSPDQMRYALSKFINNFFKHQQGNLVQTMKAMHLKAIKKNGVVEIVPDENEPVADQYGEIYYLPHEEHGHFYEYAYVPYSIPRVYFDGERFIETFKSIEGVPYNELSPAMKKKVNFWWDNLKRQVKKRFYLFPKTHNAVHMVITEYTRPNEPDNYQPVRMHYQDVLELGANPFDPNLTISLRKEPVTRGESIQTHPVDITFDDKYKNVLGIHPYAAVAGTMDYDGDSSIKDTVVPIKITRDFNKGEILLYTVEEIFDMFKDEVFTIGGREFIDLSDKNIKVLTARYHNGKLNAIFQTPKYIMRHKLEGKLYGICDTNVGVPVVTNNHGIMVNGIPKDLSHFQSTSKFNIDNVYLNMLRKVSEYNTNGKNEQECQMDREFGFLVGAFLHSGSYKKGILLSKAYYSFAHVVYSIAQKLFGKKNVKYIKEKKVDYMKGFHIATLKLDPEVIKNKLGLFIGEDGKIHLPPDVFNYSICFLKWMLKSYLILEYKCDDTNITLDSGKITLKDRRLLSQLVFILKYRFGIKDFLFNVEKKRGDLVYTVVWGYRKSQYERQDKICEVEYNDYVYDFEVPETHTFVDALGDVVLHNTVAVIYPPIKEAKLKLPKEDEEELKELKKKKYDLKMEDLYEKAQKFKYHESEDELAIKMARYNQNMAIKDSTTIRKLGGLRKRAMLFLNLNKREKIVLGKGDQKEEYEVTAELINRATDVEKVLKMREPMWLVRDLMKKDWNKLTDDEKNIVRDFHIRSRLEKKLREIKERDPDVGKLTKLLAEQRSMIDEESNERSGNNPMGLRLNLKSGRVLDWLVYSQLQGSDVLEDLDE